MRIKVSVPTIHPVDSNFRHHPDFTGINRWLAQARNTINDRGGLLDPEKGVLVGRVTKKEAEMRVQTCSAGDFLNNLWAVERPQKEPRDDFPSQELRP